MKDYYEMYLKEKLGRIKAESNIIIIKHEALLKDHVSTKNELEKYQADKSAGLVTDNGLTIVDDAQSQHSAKPTKKKRGRPRKKK